MKHFLIILCTLACSLGVNAQDQKVLTGTLLLSVRRSDLRADLPYLLLRRLEQVTKKGLINTQVRV